MIPCLPFFSQCVHIAARISFFQRLLCGNKKFAFFMRIFHYRITHLLFVCHSSITLWVQYYHLFSLYANNTFIFIAYLTTSMSGYTLRIYCSVWSTRQRLCNNSTSFSEKKLHCFFQCFYLWYCQSDESCIWMPLHTSEDLPVLLLPIELSYLCFHL